jgi:hypothetical protein
LTALAFSDSLALSILLANPVSGEECRERCSLAGTRTPSMRRSAGALLKHGIDRGALRSHLVALQRTVTGS